MCYGLITYNLKNKIRLTFNRVYSVILDFKVSEVRGTVQSYKKKLNAAFIH